jgi:F-type H+-transporting ATPase subunit delta
MDMKSWGRALVALADAEGALDVVEGELLTVADAVEGSRELTDRLADPNVPVGARLSLVESGALAAAHPATRVVLAAVIAGGHAGHLRELAVEVARAAAEARSRELAEVHVAVPLDDARREQLRAALERATGKRLDLQVYIDPEVVGGVRAKIGDTVIDGSIAKRLSDAKTRIAG